MLRCPRPRPRGLAPPRSPVGASRLPARRPNSLRPAPQTQLHSASLLTIKNLLKSFFVFMAASVNPMHQFELTNVVNIEAFGLNFSLTNGSIVLGAVVLIGLALGVCLKHCNKLIPNRRQSALEWSRRERKQARHRL